MLTSNASAAWDAHRASWRNQFGFERLERLAGEHPARRLAAVIEDLPFPQRAQTLFRRLGVVTVADLVRVAPNRLLHQPNAGDKTLVLIGTIVAKLGFTLGMSEVDLARERAFALDDRRAVRILRDFKSGVLSETAALEALRAVLLVMPKPPMREAV